MFGYFGWSYIVDAVGKLPKEIVYVGVGYLALNDITNRFAQVKIEQAKAETRKAELEVEALKLKLKLQKNETNET